MITAEWSVNLTAEGADRTLCGKRSALWRLTLCSRRGGRLFEIDFLRFAQAFMIQAAHTAISNGSAKLAERLARWLLMTHDRMDGDEMPLVHLAGPARNNIRRATTID